MKQLLFVFLMTTGSISFASWELVHKFDDSQVYIDKSHKTRVGSFVQIWSSISFNSEQVDQNIGRYQSWKSLEIFDCDKKERGIISFTYYSAKNRQGNIVKSMSRQLSEVIYKDINPGTVSALFYSFACDDQ
jgi:hypothetical protein